MLLGREAIKRTIFYSILFYSGSECSAHAGPVYPRSGVLGPACCSSVASTWIWLLHVLLSIECGMNSAVSLVVLVVAACWSCMSCTRRALTARGYCSRSPACPRGTASGRGHMVGCTNVGGRDKQAYVCFYPSMAPVAPHHRDIPQTDSQGYGSNLTPPKTTG